MALNQYVIGFLELSMIVPAVNEFWNWHWVQISGFHEPTNTVCGRIFYTQSHRATFVGIDMRNRL
jgi:hypothetical protein